ncbi:hypothetical protein JTB14_014028 [Gonioctena quinquepunctata]|nr:hypothetical protein JTB14_014028 [Gonioctena quinquepunctata]
MYEIRKGRPFYVCLKMLKLTCCLPEEDEISFGFIVKLLALRLTFIFWLILIIMHTVMAIKNKSGFGMSADISIITSMVLVTSSTFLFLCNHKSWLRLCSDINDFKEFGEPQNFEEAQKKGNLYTIIANLQHFWYFPICIRHYQ